MSSDADRQATPVDDGATILVVDDNESNRDLLVRRLRIEGHRTVSAQDGDEALELLGSRDFDLVLLDIMMPGVDGQDVLRTIRKTRSRVELPVMMVTARAETESMVRYLKDGANDYITKPVNLECLVARVNALVGLKRWQTYLASKQDALSDMVVRRTQQLSQSVDELVAESKARRLAESRMEAVLKFLPDGVCMLNRDQEVVFANRPGEAALNALTGKGKGDRIDAIGDYAISDLVVRGEAERPEVKAVNGELYEITAGCVEGYEGGYVLMLRDVTSERERQERALQQYHLASVGQLAAGISHDLNNLITVINGLAQMIDMREDLPEEIHEDLHGIFDQGQRASELIRQVLDFGRQTEARRRPLDIVPFLKEAVKMYERLVPENIRMSLKLELKECVTNVNLTQLQQVFSNLVVNAQHAMPDGGELRVSLKQREVDRYEAASLGVEAGSFAELVVTDTGCGIPEKHIRHIFDPFYSTKPRSQGTGLGLAQAFGIARQHAGALTVESVEHEGATFRLLVPIEKQVQPIPREVADYLPYGSGERVLLVEDDARVRELLKGFLDGVGYEVRTACNGVEALARLRNGDGDVDVIVTDLVMPEMGGTRLARMVRESHPEVPCIAITGYDPTGNGDAEGLSGFRSVLKKPLNLSELAIALRETLGSD